MSGRINEEHGILLFNIHVFKFIFSPLDHDVPDLGRMRIQIISLMEMLLTLLKTNIIFKDNFPTINFFEFYNVIHNYLAKSLSFQQLRLFCFKMSEFILVISQFMKLLYLLIYYSILFGEQRCSRI